MAKGETQPSLFDAGRIDAAPMGDHVSEQMVEYVGGVLAQVAWGDGARTAEQRERSITSAREAIAKLRSE